MSSQIRVLIADDHTLFAEALQAILATDGRFQVIAQAKNGEEALGVALAEKPDVVLMDIAMPVMDGIEAAALISQRLPQTRVLMLTGSDDAADIARSRDAGAVGYLTKERIAAELLEAIAEAAAA